MNKKTIIQYVIIALGFIGSGIVLYNGLHPSSTAPVSPGISSMIGGSSSGTSTPANGGAILPNGNQLDFSILDPNRFQFGLVTYPVLNLQNAVSEVGVDEHELLNATSSTSQ